MYTERHATKTSNLTTVRVIVYILITLILKESLGLNFIKIDNHFHAWYFRATNIKGSVQVIASMRLR